MNFKANILAWLALVVALDTICLTLQSQERHAAEQLHILQAAKSVKLESALRHIATELQAARDRKEQSHPIAPAPMGDTHFIPVRKEALAKVRFSLLDITFFQWTQEKKFNFNSNTAVLFGLTASEIAQVQNVFSELFNRIEDYQRASVRRVDFDQLSEIEQINIRINGFGLKSPNGHTVYYHIAPMSEEQQMALQSWLDGALAQAIGQDRTDLIMQKALTDYQDFWLMPKMQSVIAFQKHLPNEDGEIIDWIENIGIDSNGTSRGGSSKEKVPPEWAYLFKDDPTAPPPSTP